MYCVINIFIHSFNWFIPALVDRPILPVVLKFVFVSWELYMQRKCFVIECIPPILISVWKSILVPEITPIYKRCCKYYRLYHYIRNSWFEAQLLMIYIRLIINDKMLHTGSIFNIKHIFTKAKQKQYKSRILQ